MPATSIYIPSLTGRFYQESNRESKRADVYRVMTLRTSQGRKQRKNRLTIRGWPGGDAITQVCRLVIEQEPQTYYAKASLRGLSSNELVLDEGNGEDMQVQLDHV